MGYRTEIEQWEDGKIVPNPSYKDGSLSLSDDKSIGYSCGRYHFKFNDRRVRAHLLYGGTIEFKVISAELRPELCRYQSKL